MTISILFLAFFTSSPQLTHGQAANTMGGPGKGVDLNPHPQGVVSEIPLSEPKTVGNSFLFDTWHLGDIDLGQTGMLKDHFIRYDLSNHFIEIKVDNTIKAIDGSIVKGFKLLDIEGKERNYINCHAFTFEDTRLIGFFEIIASGNYSLFLRTQAKFIENDYVMQLDMGKRDNEIVKEIEYFIGFEKRVIKVPNSRNKLAEAYPMNPELKIFLKKEKINTKKEKDLIKLIDFLNQQTS